MDPVGQSYLQAKGRVAAVESELRSTDTVKRIPLTEDEELIARTKWNELLAVAPWMAEFLKAMAATENFDSRRALLNLTITYHADKGQ